MSELSEAAKPPPAKRHNSFPKNFALRVSRSSNILRAPVSLPRSKRPRKMKTSSGSSSFLCRARLAVKYDIERERAFRGGGAAPSKAGTRTRPSYLRFLLKNRKILKKAEKAFDFSPIACKLSFGTGVYHTGIPFPSSFYRLFQQKCEKTRQV